MGVKINPVKKHSNSNCDLLPSNDQIQEMENSISMFIDMLEKSNEQFKADKAFESLLKYNKEYDRILYSTISNIIYKKYESSGSAELSGTLLSNIDALVKYSESPDNIHKLKDSCKGNTTPKDIDTTRKTVIKIWDHISLASHQYTMLKQTDDDYDRKFKKRIAEYKEEMTKEMNTQMITMVGIFTALAFLIFGSISSLDGVFENLEMPLFKILSIGIIWGLCVLNMIFVFLYCIGKMTKLKFKSSDNPDSSVFQKYPIVWCTNLTLIVLLLFTSWGYFVQQNIIGEKIIGLTNDNPWLVFGIGSALILIFVIISMIFITKKIKK